MYLGKFDEVIEADVKETTTRTYYVGCIFDVQASAVGDGYVVRSGTKVVNYLPYAGTYSRYVFKVVNPTLVNNAGWSLLGEHTVSRVVLKEEPGYVPGMG